MVYVYLGRVRTHEGDRRPESRFARRCAEAASAVNSCAKKVHMFMRHNQTAAKNRSTNQSV